MYTACNRLKKSDSWIGGVFGYLSLYQGGEDWSQILPGTASTLSWLPAPPMWSCSGGLQSGQEAAIIDIPPLRRWE